MCVQKKKRPLCKRLFSKYNVFVQALQTDYTGRMDFRVYKIVDNGSWMIEQSPRVQIDKGQASRKSYKITSVGSEQKDDDTDIYCRVVYWSTAYGAVCSQ